MRPLYGKEDKRMNKRIMLLRKELNLTLEKFGQRIGVTRAAISNIETGNRKVTEQMFKSICREFNVREDWLRNGNGEMFKNLSEDEKVAAILGNIFTDKDSEIYDFKMAVFRELGKLDEKDWTVIRKLVDGISNK